MAVMIMGEAHENTVTGGCLYEFPHIAETPFPLTLYSGTEIHQQSCRKTYRQDLLSQIHVFNCTELNTTTSDSHHFQLVPLNLENINHILSGVEGSFPTQN